jgi:hypothetical protein
MIALIINGNDVEIIDWKRDDLVWLQGTWIVFMKERQKFTLWIFI